MPAVTVLQLFLSSSKPVLRFAAVRTLNKVAQSHPMSVTNCNIDMESLISDQNRCIATLAITTLLETGAAPSLLLNSRFNCCTVQQLQSNELIFSSRSRTSKTASLKKHCQGPPNSGIWQMLTPRIRLRAQATRAAWSGC